MARKALIEKLEHVKYPVRYRNRCQLCGRSRGYMGFFKLCRLCFRKLASEGKLPGVKKAVW
jgi:small subunit ribosomal protein S14